MELTAQHRHAAGLLAQGLSQRSVAGKVGKAPSTITRWAQHPAFSDLVDKIAADHEEAAAASKPTAVPAASAVSEADEFGKQARLAAKLALNELVTRQRRGESIPMSDWSRIVQVLDRFSADDADTGMTPATIAEALTNPEVAGAVIDQLAPRDRSALLAGLRAAEITQLERTRDFAAEGVRETFQHTGRFAPANVAAAWWAKWRPVLDLARESIALELSRDAHRKVAEAHDDVPDYSGIDARHDVVRIEAVLAAADPKTHDKETDR